MRKVEMKTNDAKEKGNGTNYRRKYKDKRTAVESKTRTNILQLKYNKNKHITLQIKQEQTYYT